MDTTTKRIPKEILDNLLPPYPDAYDDFEHEICDYPYKLIVLDDDPTGTQTVNNVSVYTGWDKDSIRSGFEEKNSIFFILTNSRGLTESETVKVHTDIANTIADVALEKDQDFRIISRSDSTLRGHYPVETEILKNVLEDRLKIQFDGEIICPFFPQGGRFTINNVHYVCNDNLLVPAAQTEFARDKTFGYTNSHLGKWVEEKTLGKYPANKQIYIDLSTLRRGDYTTILNQLLSCSNFNKVIVNAADYADLYVFCTALVQAEKAGKHFLYRTAASFPEVLGNVSPKSLLVKSDIIDPDNNNGALIVVGSYVNKTTRQLKELLTLNKFNAISFKSSQVFDENLFKAEIDRVQNCINKLVVEGQNVVVYTERNVLVPDSSDPEDALKLSVEISNAVTSFVKNLIAKPKFIIAKGGITSSEIAVKGLGIKRAMVMGQILKGVPVWMTGSESKFPHMPYIIFPGNVGDDDALKEVAMKLL